MLTGEKTKKVLFFAIVPVLLPWQSFATTMPVYELPPTSVIEITREGFNPKEIMISARQRVRFTNKDTGEHWPASNPHPTHEDLNGFDPLRPLAPGDSWEYTPATEGSWGFHDHLYPHRRGLILVNPALDRGAFTSPFQVERAGLKGWVENSLSEISLAHAISWVASFLKSVFSVTAPTANTESAEPAEIKKLLAEKNPEIQKMIVYDLAKKYGPLKALEYMRNSGFPFTGQAHLLVHEIGNFAYTTYGEDALKYCDESFLSACYHGVILHELGDRGLTGVSAMITRCQDAGKPVFTQCSHAAGHGFLAWKDYKVLEALPLCDRLGVIDPSIPLFNCYDGVFMENIFGVHEGQPSSNRMVKADDPRYPCNAVPEKYQNGCWANQATLMYQLFSGDLQKVALACDAVKNEQYKKTCYNNLARQIHPLAGGDITETVKLCSVAGETWKDYCLLTVAGAAFSVGDRAVMPYQICATLQEESKKTCYTTLFGLIALYGDTEERRAEFCRYITEPDEKRMCFERFSISELHDKDAEINMMKKIAERQGVQTAYDTLKKNWGAKPAHAHDLAHAVGALAEAKLGMSGFSMCDSSFAFGCYHGFLEALLKKHGASAISRAEDECLALVLSGNSVSCIHGIGHGVMASSIDISQALAACNRVIQSNRSYCYDGVFMEYFSGTMQKQAVDARDPWKFCLGQSERHQRECVRNNTMFLLHADIAQTPYRMCADLPKNLSEECVHTTGLFAGQSALGDPTAAKDICKKFESGSDQASCAIAAAQEFAFEGYITTAPIVCATFAASWNTQCTAAVRHILDSYGKQ